MTMTTAMMAAVQCEGVDGSWHRRAAGSARRATRQRCAAMAPRRRGTSRAATRAGADSASTAPTKVRTQTVHLNTSKRGGRGNESVPEIIVNKV